jgi:uncharacterized protein YjbJ (UPF0337 family)
MGFGDRMRHKKDEALGKARKKYGEASGDPNREAEGRGQQRSAYLKQAGERLRAAFKK